MSPRLAFATDAKHADLTSEDRHLAGHLERRGLAVTPARWDDPGVDWRSFDAVVVRSCWDYHLRLGEFEDWLDGLEAAGAAVHNPVPTLRWNRRKTYLEDLHAAGFDVVPTVFLDRGPAPSLAGLMVHLGADELVLKPTVGASAHGLWTTSRERAGAHQPRLAAGLAAGDLMAQPRLAEVETRGEWSLVYLGGRYSHAVRKLPGAGDFRVQHELGGVVEPATPPAPLRAAGDRLVGWLTDAPLYARVDLVEAAGKALLMELELIEPWLFLETDPESPERFRRALVERL